MTQDSLRRLPSVDRLLRSSLLAEAVADLGEDALIQAAREELAARRTAIAEKELESPDFKTLTIATLARAEAMVASPLRAVINATGVIIHTNLGRAPLSQAAVEAMRQASLSYSNLEFDIDEGERGSRHDHVESLLRRLTGAEAGMAVNNNAAALLLALSALASSREVIISRGQLVEIGGGFRIPDVMRQSGAALVEVGTTNRTYLSDYADAVSEQTASLMRVHPSNFRVSGFAEAVGLEEMVSLARSRGVLSLDDLGSGCLLETQRYGLAPEPRPQDSLKTGADLVLFSGDKLLGGPQAGIILGRQDLISRLKRHPLARAVRLDKGTIAALNATLLHYLKGEAEAEIPVWRMISMPFTSIQSRARRWARAIGPGARVVDSRSVVGGGSLPEESLSTAAVSIDGQKALSADAIASRLRAASPPVIARIENDQVLLDPRTVEPDKDRLLLDSVTRSLEP